MLAQFANTTAEARRQYRQFIGSGLATTTSTDFDGGDLIRSRGGWENPIQAPKAHEQHPGDERVLGDTAFVERMLKQDRLPINEDSQLQREGWDLNRLVERVCRHFKIDPTQNTQGPQERIVLDEGGQLLSGCPDPQDIELRNWRETSHHFPAWSPENGENRKYRRWIFG